MGHENKIAHSTENSLFCDAQEHFDKQDESDHSTGPYQLERSRQVQVQIAESFAQRLFSRRNIVHEQWGNPLVIYQQRCYPMAELNHILRLDKKSQFHNATKQGIVSAGILLPSLLAGSTMPEYACQGWEAESLRELEANLGKILRKARSCSQLGDAKHDTLSSNKQFKTITAVKEGPRQDLRLDRTEHGAIKGNEASTDHLKTFNALPSSDTSRTNRRPEQSSNAGDSMTRLQRHCLPESHNQKRIGIHTHPQYHAQGTAMTDCQDLVKCSKVINRAPLRAFPVEEWTKENLSLKKDIMHWRRMHDEAHNMKMQGQDHEADLRAQLERLLIETNVKDTRIGELEWERDNLRSQLQDVHNLEQANLQLERRLELFGHMLAHSPPSATSNSHAKKIYEPQNRLVKHTPRSMSLTVRLPTHSEDIDMVRETSIHESPSPASSHRPQGYTDDTIGISQDFHHAPARFRKDSRYGSPDDHFDSASVSQDEDLFDAQLSRSYSSISRPSSIVSTIPDAEQTWPMSPLQHPGEDSRPGSRKRRMRRFASGSKSLKPLVLPVTTHLQSPSISHAESDDAASITSNDFADVPIRGLSVGDSDCKESDMMLADPSIPSRRSQSSERAHEQALHILEGRHSLETEDDDRIHETPRASRHNRRSAIHSVNRTPNNSRLAALRSTTPRLDTSFSSYGNQERTTDDFAFPGATNLSSGNLDLYKSLHDSPIQGTRHAELDFRSRIDESIRRASRRSQVHGPGPTSAPRPAASMGPDIYSVSNSIHGASQQYQDPIVIARRVLANAWSLSPSPVLERAAWWLFRPGLHYEQDYKSESSNSKTQGTGVLPDTAEEDRHGEVKFRSSPNIARREGSALDPQVESLSTKRRAQQSGSRPKSSDCQNIAGTINGDKLSRRATCSCRPDALGDESDHNQNPVICDKSAPSTRQKFRLWFQFSLTICLAIGMAVRYGPAALLEELPLALACTPVTDPSRTTESEDDEMAPIEQHVRHDRRGLYHGKLRGRLQRQSSPSATKSRNVSGETSNTDESLPDSGYGGSIVFAQTLESADSQKQKKCHQKLFGSPCKDETSSTDVD